MDFWKGGSYVLRDRGFALFMLHFSYACFHCCHLVFVLCKKVSEYDQKIPQSHNTDQPTAL